MPGSATGPIRFPVSSFARLVSMEDRPVIVVWIFAAIGFCGVAAAVAIAIYQSRNPPVL